MLVLNRIVLIGAGNVGYHLGQRLAAVGLPLVQVYSRTALHAHELALLTGAQPTVELGDITPDADLYLLAVPDDHIASVARTLRAFLPEQALVAHTSGATPSSLLAAYFTRYGVFYPLQTFSRGRAVDFSQAPLCIHAGQAADLTALIQLAQLLSNTVSAIDDQQRAVLHVAAVFVNNFVNYLYQVGHAITTQAQLPHELLQPLIAETAAKVQTLAPHQAQTGPAIRGDQATIQRHLTYLQAHPQWQAIYQLLSSCIAQGQDLD